MLAFIAITSDTSIGDGARNRQTLLPNPGRIGQVDLKEHQPSGRLGLLLPITNALGIVRPRAVGGSDGAIGQMVDFLHHWEASAALMVRAAAGKPFGLGPVKFKRRKGPEGSAGNHS